MATQDTIRNFVNQPMPAANANAPTMPPVPLNAQPAQAATPAQTSSAQTGTATNKPSPTAKTQPTGKVAGTVAATGAGAVTTVTDTVSAVAGSVEALGNGIENWAANLPTPGGIGLLLVILFVLLWMVVPVNNSNGQHYTRMQLLWYTLTGRTAIGGPAEQTSTGTGTGSGGPFVLTQPANSNGSGILPITDLQVFNLPDFATSSDFSVGM